MMAENPMTAYDKANQCTPHQPITMRSCSLQPMKSDDGGYPITSDKAASLHTLSLCTIKITSPVLFQESLDKKVVPEYRKKTAVCPIYKNGKRCKLAPY